MFNKLKINLKDIVYYLSLFLFFCYLYLNITLIQNSLLLSFVDIALYSSLIGFVAKMIFFDEYKGLDLLYYGILILLGFIIWRVTTYKVPFILFIFIFSSKEMDFKKIAKFAFTFGAIYLFILFILSQRGFILDLTYTRGDGKLRHALGSNYPTIYSQRFFYVVLLYIFLKEFCLKYYQAALLLIINYLVFYFTDARLDFYLTSIVILFFLIYPFIDLRTKTIISGIFVIFPIFCGGLIIWLSYTYNSFDPTWYKLDKLFSGRLNLGHQAFVEYPIRLFGTKLYLQGNGGLSGLNNVTNQYFFLDSGYLVALIEYGLIYFIITMSYLTIFLVKIFKKSYFGAISFFAFISVYSMISGSIFSAANIFILMLCAYYIENDDKKINLYFKGEK